MDGSKRYPNAAYGAKRFYRELGDWPWRGPFSNWRLTIGQLLTLQYAGRQCVKFSRSTLSERGAVSLPLLAFQACAAIGLVSGVAAVVAWAQGVVGGLL